MPAPLCSVRVVMCMFVVVGEALVDLVGQRGGRTFVAHPGGSPANVALGLARLGVPVTLMTRLGSDGLGEMIFEHLRASGVRVNGGPARGKGMSTSLAIATLAAGVASYDFRIEWDMPALAPPADRDPLPAHRFARDGAGARQRERHRAGRAGAHERSRDDLLRPECTAGAAR